MSRAPTVLGRNPREGGPLPRASPTPGATPGAPPEEEMSGVLFSEPGGPLRGPPSSGEGSETAFGEGGPPMAATQAAAQEEETGAPHDNEVSLLRVGGPSPRGSNSTDRDSAERQLLLGSPAYSLPQQETEEAEETDELSGALETF
ncbi:uncharacterized protein EMH_0100260 [Eimeria mitis]|uniref:Uncharacterized protein n=1 Tax=Eimeria mitis TaxID=44415 RepID=U6KFZ7_9EIME|nr:uncharacterized protein EMH_0100260 [Eimeria mitis]CDJ35721.1 hypothetical protein, conserved [Eimeria mitis]